MLTEIDIYADSCFIFRSTDFLNLHSAKGIKPIKFFTFLAEAIVIF